MAFESFYGGRQGASFVIVKRFDAIDLKKVNKALLAITDDPISEAGLPTYWYDNTNSTFIKQTEDNISEYTWYSTDLNGKDVPVRFLDTQSLSAKKLPDVKGVTPYKGTYLAITNDTVNSETELHTYLYDDENHKFIERDSDNYTEYYWNFVVLDGSSVKVKNISAETYGTQNLPIANAEGMVQCFEQGGETTNIVNYGEYVIIDTPHKSDPDNGKVFRRGLTYNDDLAGAEYIGQIVGPEGQATEIAIGHESNISENPNSHSGTYSVDTEDLIPGKEIVEGQTIYHDNITYSWVTLRDKYGHIQTSLIGFTFPYFVLDFSAEGESPYYNLNPDGTINPDISLIDRVDDGSHPFYENWKLHIPHGIKGDSIVDVELVNTTSQIDSVYYKDPELTIIVPGKITNQYAPIINLDQIDFKTATSLPIDIDGTVYYIENDLPYHKNTTTAKLRYKKYNYDKSATGEYEYVEIAPYNVVRSMWVDPDGDLYANYTHTNIQNLGKIKLVKGTFGIVQIWANQSLLFDDNPDPEARVAIPPEYMNYARYKRDKSEPFIMDPKHPETGYDDRYIGWIAGVDPAEGSEDQYPSFYYYDYTAKKEEDKWNFIGMLDGSMYDPETIFAIREANDDPKDILREKGVWALAEKRKAI